MMPPALIDYTCGDTNCPATKEPRGEGNAPPRGLKIQALAKRPSPPVRSWDAEDELVSVT